MTRSFIDHLPKMRKIDISASVTVTLPVHVWISFWSALESSQWDNAAANLIAIAAQEEIVDPEYIQEKIRKAEEERSELRKKLSSASSDFLNMATPEIEHEDNSNGGYL